MAGKGILWDENRNIIVSKGSMVVGDSTLQEVAIIIALSTGAQKFVPVLGPNLIQLKKTNASRFDIEQRVRVHLAKDGKDYQQIKDQIKTTINK